MLRNSRFDADEIEREKGVIVEEMNMYADTPRSYIGNVWERHLYGDQPLGWDIIGTEETVRGRDARDVPRLPRPLVPARSAWWSGSADAIGDDVLERLEELLGDIAAARRPARPSAVVLPDERRRRCGSTRSSPTRRTSSSARRSYPHGHPDRYAVQLLATVLGGGMSSRLFTEVRERRGLAYYVFCGNNSLRRRRHARRAGRRRPQPDRRGGRDDRRRAAPDRRPSRCPADELEKARSFAKGRFVLGLESPHATIMFGLRREVLEGRAVEPDEVLAGLDAVTVEDVQRVAADILGGEPPPRA